MNHELEITPDIDYSNIKVNNSKQCSNSYDCSSDSNRLINFYPYTLNEIINKKYRIIEHINDGTFGSVFKCENIITKELYAMKILSKIDNNFELAECEADLAKKVLSCDKKNESHCAKILDTFIFKKNGVDYYAMIIELLGPSLYNFLEDNGFKGYTMSQIQHIAKQIFEGISFLHKNKMIHTDLKPENILLVNSDYENVTRYQDIPLNIALRKNKKAMRSRNASGLSTNISRTSIDKLYYKKLINTDIKIIDFGSAVELENRGGGVICTRQYRPPEVILDCCLWDQKSDIWSIGCILVELYTGEMLFSTHNDEEQLCLMEKCCGHYPNWMINNTRNEQLKKIFLDCNRHKEDKVLDIRLTKHYDKIKEALLNQRTIEESICNKHSEFCDFIKFLLKIDPKKRPTAKEALRHSFFKKKFID